MKKIFFIITNIFIYFTVQSAADIKYATAQEIETKQQQDAGSLTPLIEAVIEKDIPKIKALFEQKKQASWFSRDTLRINAQDKTGQTALMWAIINQLPTDIIKLLLSVKNIALNQEDNQGLNALGHAVITGNEEVVQELLKACKLEDGICLLVNQRDKKLHWTPFARAVIDGNSKIIKLLLQAGANPTAIVRRGDKIYLFLNYIKVMTKKLLN